MKLSTKTRYGVRAMIDIAENYSGKPVLVKEIAARQDISEKYLEHIMLELKKAGFVESISGAKGGFVLKKNPEQIKMIDIVVALEGNLSIVSCVEDKNFCSSSSFCVARDLWVKVKKEMEKVLEGVTLKELAELQKEKKKTVLYYI